MLTKKGKYGLKALVDLARLDPGETAFITEIATRNNIPKKFLDAILLELRNAGVLKSKKGPAAATPCLVPPRRSASVMSSARWMVRSRRFAAPAARPMKSATIATIRTPARSVAP